MLMDDLDIWDVSRNRQRVIHQRAAQQLTVGVVDDRLAEDAAQTLRRAAHDLAFDQHRIDDVAAIVGDRVIRDLDPAGLAVDLDDRDMHRIAPSHGRRLPVKSFLEPGIAARAIRASVTVVPGTPTTPTPPSRSSRSAGAHSSRLAAVENTFSRSRSLA